MEIKNLRLLKGKKDKEKRERIKPIKEKFGPGEKPLAKTEIKELFADVNFFLIKKGCSFRCS
jgi:hypothetical protein